ncbi:hypothetical protein CCACVL1_12151 [Corchorus capsularis]|uniref:Uncharacterized protein n=1 Tax=Corchorus capsularis TaxID=210143 RepID=A0A1R3IH10_COCAP|nr:hypothetical protein CCACVL1_12151 [Corchorus capsularis]
MAQGARSLVLPKAQKKRLLEKSTRLFTVLKTMT